MMENKKLYTCPMHPEVVANSPGHCPKCGMSLVLKTEIQPIKKRHAGHNLQMFKVKFWITLMLTIPVFIYSEMITEIFHWSAPHFTYSSYVPMIFGTIIFFYGGLIFLKGAWQEIRSRQPGMMTLISLAIITAYSYSLYATLTEKMGSLYLELSSLIAIMLLGHWLEMKAVGGAQNALKEISKLLPNTAELLTGKETKKIPVNELKLGDIVIVRPGARIPGDGRVVEGESNINESLLTGESAPSTKRNGDKVVGGSINGDGSLKIKIEKIGEETFISGVKRLISEAETSKSKLQILSDRAAFYLTIIAVAAGAATFILWYLTGAGVNFAVERMVAVLVITCPHALGLAIPLVVSISTGKAARNGFLVRDRLALELARSIDTVVFDKTGTLTTGEYGIEKIIALGDKKEEEILQLAASVDNRSEHFVARAIVKEAEKRKIKLSAVTNFIRLPGKGVSGDIADKKIMVGGENILKKNIPKILQTGTTIVYILENNKLQGAITLSDKIRAESFEAIQELKQMGIKVVMITGDSEDVAKTVANALNIDEYFARVLPKEKSEKIKSLQTQGRKTAMVGDGINDAPALIQADLGIAIGAGANVAVESAGIILAKNDPRDIAKIIRLSRATYVKMIQNLFWATGYNVIAIPLAAGALISQGIILSPAVSAILMSASTIIVAFNATLLRSKE